VVPFNPLCEAGEIETLTPLKVVTCAMQLFSAVTVLSVWEVAVTVMLSSLKLIALSGTVTLSVAVLFSPAGTMSDVGKTVGPQFSLSLTVKL